MILSSMNGQGYLCQDAHIQEVEQIVRYRTHLESLIHDTPKRQEMSGAALIEPNDAHGMKRWSVLCVVIKRLWSQRAHWSQPKLFYNT